MIRPLALTQEGALARVHVMEDGNGRCLECVEALSPPLPQREKWVLMISTLWGCPVGCPFCDAGGGYQGRVSLEDMLAQVEHMVLPRYPDRRVDVAKFKIQLARMGEPALNPAVLDLLAELPRRWHAPGLMPSFSTVAPRGGERVLEAVAEVKDSWYSGGHFQMQFSVHSTRKDRRDELIPVPKWDLEQISRFAEGFLKPGDRKVTLNFALSSWEELQPNVLSDTFDPQRFLIKLTPVNPTHRAREHQVGNALPQTGAWEHPVVQTLVDRGWEVLVSIGELEENRIGSNCGQYVRRNMEARERLPEAYTYTLSPEPERVSS